MRQQAMNFGTRIITDDIVDVDFSQRPFKLKRLEGAVTKAHAVIVATGARANYLGLPSEEAYKNRGVSACAVCDGALPRFRNKPLVVVGGGDSAVEEATYLTKFASRVYMVHRRDRVAGVEDHGPARGRQPEDRDPSGTRSWTKCWATTKQGVTGVRLKSTNDGSDHNAEATGVFLAIGHTPNTTFLEGKLELTQEVHRSGRRRSGPTPASKACSPPATWPTTTTARRSPPPAPAAWPRSTPNAGWRRKELNRKTARATWTLTD